MNFNILPKIRLSLIVLLLTSLVFISCSKEETKESPRKGKVVLNTVSSADELSKYISAFTSGEISKASPILVQFAADMVSNDEVGKESSDFSLNFEPILEGTSIWLDKRTLKFVPEEVLKTAQSYLCEVNLSELFENVPEELTTFQFQFFAIPTSLDIVINPLKTQNSKNISLQKLEGELISSDYEDPTIIEDVVRVFDKRKSQKIIWSHSQDGRIHKFIVENIERGKSNRNLLITWDADDLNIEFEGKKSLTVYRVSDFKFITAKAMVDPERHVLLNFSDPLRENQDLNGIIRISDLDLKFIIDGNIVKAYPANPNSYFSGKMDVFVEPGVKNSLDDRISDRSKVEIEFVEINPQVLLVGNGTIAPKSNKVLFPFKAVNLDSIDIQIVKIFEKNIPQFLQVNNLPDTRELRRVAELVLDKKIVLDEAKQLRLTEWNNFSLDLSEFVNLDPGSIYRVSVGFRKSYSLYPGARPIESPNDNRSPFVPLVYHYESSAWDNYETWNSWEFPYKERNNPRHKVYYGPERTVSRNIIASDLGIIAKQGEDRNMIFAVTDLNTTKPLSNVSLEIYNYQNTLLESVTTDGDGFAKVDLTTKPFLLVAKHGTQRGYLKLLDGNSLSLSRFDISGQNLQKGIKGFIYGERGVWRPGDKIYLTFILEDANNLLPKEHPVSFDLLDSRGQLVKRIVSSDGLNGFYSFHAETSESSPTGTYSAVVKVGGSTFTKSIPVETIMPNRLKINLDLKKEFLTKKDKSYKADLDVHWLHGAVAKDLKTVITASLSTITTKFTGYENYTFDNPTLPYESHTETIFEGTLNNKGVAQIPISFKTPANPPGMLKSNIICKVFEPGGAFSRDYYNIKYHPYETYVGLSIPKGDKRNMLLTDKDHIMDVVTLNSEGQPVSRKNIEVKVYKISWRWWWDRSRDNLTNYNSSTLKNFVTKATINTGTNGKGTATLRINQPSWGRFLVVVNEPGGHSVAKTVYIDWPGWARKSKDQGGETMLSFTSDKPSYVVGDDITLQIPSGKNGRALISIESGSKVIEAHWAEAENGLTKFVFEATPQMAPNIYAHVTLLQPHGEISNDLPIRLYGVIPISIENPATHIQPQISMPDVLRPEESFEVEVKENKGKEMTYTIAVVDEGLLDLTKFKTPDPWSTFYAREALKVKTWDMYNEVIGYNGREFDVLLAIGGDGENKASGESKVNRFKPVVKFLGPFHLDDGETQKHTIKMPMYIGSVKTMVVAGYEGAFGKAHKVTPVRKPLMLLGTLPRVLGPEEELEFYLSVFASEESVKDVDVTISTDDLIEIVGEKKKRITFTESGDLLVSFPVKVKSKVGVAKIKARAQSGSEVAEYNFDIEIRNPNTMTAITEQKVLKAGETWDFDTMPLGIEGTNSGVLEVSSLPSINLDERLDYLIRYPHGCIEQTTSAVFPQLQLNNLLELTQSQKDDIDINLRNAINRIKLFQLPNGALSYWPGSDYASLWGTNYAGHFMLEVEKLGYQLPVGFKNKWVSFQKKQADDWDPTVDRSDLMQAYRLFLLAFSGNPRLGAMNRFKENDKTRNTARWLLAAAYHLAGQVEVAKKMAGSLNTTVKDYREFSYTYGSSLRDRGIMLFCMDVLGYNENSTFVLTKNISEALSGKRWWSTQTVSYCLLSLGKYYKNLDSKFTFTYKLNNETIQNVEKNTPLERIDLKPKADKPIALSLSNTGENAIFPIVTLRGIPQIGDEFDAENNIKLEVNYKNLKGILINPTNINHGTDFYAEVKVTNPGVLGNLQEVALTQIFPSGWEIHNSRLLPEDSKKYDRPKYQDIRDDRMYTYFDLGAKKSKTFRVMLNASYTGKFYMPAVYVEVMYDATINAQKKGKWVNVVKE